MLALWAFNWNPWPQPVCGDITVEHDFIVAAPDVIPPEPTPGLPVCTNTFVVT